MRTSAQWYPFCISCALPQVFCTFKQLYLIRFWLSAVLYNPSLLSYKAPCPCLDPPFPASFPLGQGFLLCPTRSHLPPRGVQGLPFPLDSKFCLADRAEAHLLFPIICQATWNTSQFVVSWDHLLCSDI